MSTEHFDPDTELVFGDEAAPDAHLEALRLEVAALRAEFAAVAAPEPRGELARLLGTAPDHAAGAVVPLRPAGRAPGLRRIRRRLVVAIAAVVGTALVMTGLAAANALPDPVQRVVDDVLSHAGLGSVVHDAGAAPTGSSTVTTAAGTTTTGAGGVSSAPAPADPSAGSPAPAVPTTLPPAPALAPPPPSLAAILRLLGVSAPATDQPTTNQPGTNQPAPTTTTAAPLVPLPLPPLPTAPPTTLPPTTRPPTTLPPTTLPKLPPPPLPPLLP
ncbi:MAG TPA: hypothetical protein VFC99_04345 [Acidimicrobiia bacterium]|nr:hypothetical protein [Acidimicrobiia bacterium]